MAGPKSNHRLLWCLQRYDISSDVVVVLVIFGGECRLFFRTLDDLLFLFPLFDMVDVGAL